MTTQSEQRRDTNEQRTKSNHTGLRVLGGMVASVLYVVGAVVFFTGLLFFRNCGTYVDTGIGMGELVDRGAHLAGLVMMPLGGVLLLIGGFLTWLAFRKRSSQISGSLR